MRADRPRVVVTGLGATTPLGGDVAVDLGSDAGRAQRSARADRRLGHGPAGADRRRRPRSTRRRCWTACRPAGWTGASSSRWSPRGRPGPTRARRRWTRSGSAWSVSSGIGGIGSTLAAYDTLKEKGWQRHLAVHRADADAERLGRVDRHRAGRPGRGAHHGQRLRVRRRGDRLRHRHDQVRPGRRRAGRRHRGGDHAAEHRARSPPCGRCPPATTSRSGPRARSTRAGTASCSARAPAWWCWSRAEHARRARRRGVRGRGRGRLLLRRAPHRPARPRRRRHRSRPSSGRWPTPRWTRIRSCTSTRTPPPRRRVTWSRRRPSRRRSGPAADGVVVSATKSMTGHLLGGAGAVESVAAILALREQVAPPTINLDDPDDGRAGRHRHRAAAAQPRGSEPMAVLNNSFGFGGHNVVARLHRRLTGRGRPGRARPAVHTADVGPSRAAPARRPR